MLYMKDQKNIFKNFLMIHNFFSRYYILPLFIAHNFLSKVNL